MTLSSNSATLLHDALCKIATLYAGEEDQLVSTDFYFMPDSENGCLFITDDNDVEIALVEIPEWKECASESFYAEVESTLREAIKGANADGELERLAVWMPYSFVLVDENRESVCDLLLVDDDTLLVTDSLLEGLDKELNDFIAQLLEE